MEIKDTLWTIGKIAVGVGVLAVGAAFIWVATFDIPDINSFSDRRVEQSTKIYDRTGETVLYDLNKNVRRTTVPLSAISDNLQAATLAIEDSGFYSHLGIKPSAILRAAWTNLKAGGFEQGGSTITQQVVKNTLLTPEKTISRKIKEWILALRLDQRLTKENILEVYLNEVPYGGRVYGAEAAANRYFDKSASDLTIAESAYLAALPKAPTYYSPYGNNRDELDQRKNEVLREMQRNNFITSNEFEQARSADVTFSDKDQIGLRAPHFVFHVRKYLEEEYGTEAIERRGLKVITTLDYELQQEAESILETYGEENAQRFNANNAALVAVDPNSGKVRTMVGSRDYGNEDIEGNFNAATALRQPGSSFKPFAYATAFNKGYTDDTVVFDLPTQFSNICPSSQFSSQENCFSPVNYDEKFRGPISLRDALAQSVNVPSVKTLYLAGMEDSLETANEMGISTLEPRPDRYGLSLVLGSGEVTLLDITSSYGVFANEGIKNPHTSIKRIEDSSGEVLEEFSTSSEQVLPEQTARLMSDVLSDNAARTPAFGPNSPLQIENYDVAAKTGTTNDYKDLWTVGYSPNLAVGVWSGNNDNTSVNGEVAGFVVAPMWKAFMQEALSKIENDTFQEPEENLDNLKPILRGQWQRTQNTTTSANGVPVRTQSGGINSVHNILHWVDKNNPRGPVPVSPQSDPQYDQWEYSVRQWVNNQGFETVDATVVGQPDNTDEGSPEIDIPEAEDNFLNLTSSIKNQYDENEILEVSAENNGQLDRLEVFVNGTLVGDDDSQPFSISVNIDDADVDEENSVIIRGINQEGRANDISRSVMVNQ
jgi:1A family penicillin-binding protein